MTTDLWIPSDTIGAAASGAAIRSSTGVLRALVVGAGICSSMLFAIVALRYELQMYGDGSVFSYSVAVRDGWAFHWHNISDRLFVFLYSLWPAQAYVGLTGDARGGIDVYGLLFYSAQLLGLIATFTADRSPGRILFCYACLSTAGLCPLVFGFPTEMWLAHAVFWPALALCHYARRGIAGTVAVFAALLALVLTHEGGVVFAFAILFTVLLRGTRDAAVPRTAGALFVAMVIWFGVKLTFPPDGYFAGVLARAAFNFIDLGNLVTSMSVSLIAALAGYGIVFLILWRLLPKNANVYAVAIVAAALAVYWLWFDNALHADSRYYMRTALLFATPAIGMLAALHVLHGAGRLSLPIPFLPRVAAVFRSEVAVNAAAGAFLLVLLVHTVETEKFVTAWANYRGAVRTLAMGTASDPALGDTRFVSSGRIGADLNRLSWVSTTQFLSVLVAPKFAPLRLVVDPAERYFWFTCATAADNQEADRPIPVESRRLVRIHTCLHR